MSPSGTADSRARFEHPPADPTLARASIEHSSWHRALGLVVRCDTNDARIHQAAFDVFGPSLPPGDPRHHPDALIRLFVHHVDEEPGFRPRQPLVRVYDGIFSIAASRSSVVAGDTRTGVVSGFVSDTVAGSGDFVRVTLLQSAFLQVAQSRSLVAIHAACLARDGRSLMLRGDSGAGKSTLAYAALLRGYALVSEDVVFLRSRGGLTAGRVAAADVELHGLPWTLHLLPDAPGLFPELAGARQFERPDGRMKIGIRVNDRFPGQAQPSAPLGPLVFVERGRNDTPSLTPIDRVEARRRLRETAIHYEEAADAEHGIWDALLSLPAYLLVTGDDSHANAAMLDDVMCHA